MTRRFRWALTAIVLTGFALALFRLDHFSYRLDEILQAYWISGDWAYFWKSLRSDAVHPPLDYALGKLFESFHPSDAARKLLPALWGAGGVTALGVLLARRGGEALGLTAAGLLAFAPHHVRFSQELRPYSLALFLLCLALWALDRFLERPGPARLGMLYVACLATLYALYTAAVVLAIAATALIAEDAITGTPERRRSAKPFLAWSPLFLLGLALAYLPWWPVVLTSVRRPPTALPAVTLERAAGVASFLAFEWEDGAALSTGGWLFLLLVACGTGIAAGQRGLRFLAVWAFGGVAAIEALSRWQPLDASRGSLPAGPALTALAALTLAALLARPVARLAGTILLAAILVLDARSLEIYFRRGRPDWRPVADYLRREAAPSERVFTENRHTQLCVAFYLVGPRWLFDTTEGREAGRSVVSLDGDARRIASAWRPGARGWLVLAAEPEDRVLRRWSASFPSETFPAAAGAIVRRVDSAAPAGR